MKVDFAIPDGFPELTDSRQHEVNGQTGPLQFPHPVPGIFEAVNCLVPFGEISWNAHTALGLLLITRTIVILGRTRGGSKRDGGEARRVEPYQEVEGCSFMMTGGTSIEASSRRRGSSGIAWRSSRQMEGDGPVGSLVPESLIFDLGMGNADGTLILRRS